MESILILNANTADTLSFGPRPHSPLDGWEVSKQTECRSERVESTARYRLDPLKPFLEIDGVEVGVFCGRVLPETPSGH